MKKLFKKIWDRFIKYYTPKCCKHSILEMREKKAC